ncbi:MAG: peptidoglycan DD-metalloendopeptidase family protein [Planctomycetaceae bacterium]|nr:peptidoglycan DD-metalloendopeptidase family protein [Planctomycetaceae bacterium]
MFRLFAASLFLVSSVTFALAEELKPIEPLVRVVDLNVGEEVTVTLCDGSSATVKLLELKEHRDPVRLAVRSSDLKLEVNGEEIALKGGCYLLPQPVGAVKIDCTVTKGLNSNGTPTFWGLKKDARFRIWPVDSPLVQPGTMIYPVKQDWLATRTWFDNETVDGGPSILKKIYYHSGLDIGASEGLVEVIAATDALVVQRGEDVLEGHEKEAPTAPRSDVVYLLDGRGWYYRYSHLKEIDPSIQLGKFIKMGMRIGVAGKEGASGGWSHLHFEMKSRQPSGEWGTQAGYAIMREICIRDEKLEIIANARPGHFIVAGQETTLDGTRSWSAHNELHYEWQFDDGSTATGAQYAKAYPQPGSYMETLKVTDSAGNVDYDFTHVLVLDPDDLEHYPPGLNANFHPSQNLKVGDEVTFKVRAFRMQGGEEEWDFGDGSLIEKTASPGDSHPHDPQGYAEIKHRYHQPGHYIVTIRRTSAEGSTAITRLHVPVGE